MKVVEGDRDRLILSFRESLWCSLLFGIASTMGGIFCSLVGIALKKVEASLAPIGSGWILPLGMGISFVAFGLFWLVNVTTSKFIFDKSKNSLVWEKHHFLNVVVRSVNIPLHLIVGITIEKSTDPESLGYYTNLIVTPLFWRIALNYSEDCQSMTSAAKKIAEFLNISYFANKAKAPERRMTEKSSKPLESWQESWRYLENEIERLSQYLSQHPQDAEGYQDLGMSLYELHPFLNRKKAIVYLKKAEELFETQQCPDRAAVARALQALVR